MVSFALRRVLLAIPTLVGVTIAVFVLTTVLSTPAESAATLEERLRAEDGRRDRFIDLPRFFNASPHDVVTRVNECIAHIAANDASRPFYEARLAELGGAALVYLLPGLNTLPEPALRDVSLALAPVARRMGGFAEIEVTDPERAPLFWQHFWEDRTADFTEQSVRRSLGRWLALGGDARRRELEGVDTFALPWVIQAMSESHDRVALARLTDLARHLSGHSTHASGSTADALRLQIIEWQSWWLAHESDYVRFVGVRKAAATISETRYAKWLLGVVRGSLGLSTRDGLPVVDKLRARAPVTLGMALLALMVAGVVAVPLGVWAAWKRGAPIDVGVSVATLLLASVPTFFVAHVLGWLGHGERLILPVLALSTLTIPAIVQQQRAAMIEVLRQDYVRAARAKGARGLRVALHAFRNALMPMVTLAGVQVPALIGGAFVVEEVFQVQGMGWETLRAIEARDAAWIIAVALVSAVITTACLLASDLLYGMADPRVREGPGRRRL